MVCTGNCLLLLSYSNQNLEAAMQFNQTNYPLIKEACASHKDIEFIVPMSATAFERGSGSTPQEWTTAPPLKIPREEYERHIVSAGNTINDELARLELEVYLEGGKIFYKASENKQVAIRVSWQK